MNKFVKSLSTLFLWYLLMFPLSVFGQTPPATPLPTPTPPASPGGGPPVTLSNPLKNISDITGLLQAILSIIMVFAVPLIVFMIIYAGFLYVTAQGNESKVTTANKALLYALVGGVIILGAQAILKVIEGTVAAF